MTGAIGEIHLRKRETADTLVPGVSVTIWIRPRI